MKKLESLLPENIKAEPQSRHSNDVVIIFEKNADEMLLSKNFKRYGINFEKLSSRKYLLKPTDGESNDILRDYVARYFENEQA